MVLLSPAVPTTGPILLLAPSQSRHARSDGGRTHCPVRKCDSPMAPGQPEGRWSDRCFSRCRASRSSRIRTTLQSRACPCGTVSCLKSVGHSMKPNDQLCYCFHVSQRKIINFIRIHRPRVPSQLSECGGAGTGCGWCVPFLRKLFDAAGQSRALPIELTADEYAAQRSEWVVAGGRVLPPGATPIRRIPQPPVPQPDAPDGPAVT